MAYTPNADITNRPEGSDKASGLTLELQKIKQKLVAVNTDLQAKNTSLTTSVAELTTAVTDLTTSLSLGVLPIGSILQGPFTAYPANWRYLDGAEYSRTTYADLWAFIQANYTRVDDVQKDDFPGAFTNGDGTTTFRVPNMSGLFVRGVGGNSLGIGELQQDAFEAHTHTVLGFGGGLLGNDGGDNGGGHTNTTSSTGDIETRPVNVAWRWVIRVL